MPPRESDLSEETLPHHWAWRFLRESCVELGLNRGIPRHCDAAEVFIELLRQEEFHASSHPVWRHARHTHRNWKDWSKKTSWNERPKMPPLSGLA